MDDLLAKYAGREPLLISAVEAKYSGAQGVPLFKDEAMVRAGAELVEREAEAREAERMAARLRAERAEAACLEEGVDLEEAVAAVCAEAGASQALERVVGALFDADPSQAAAVVQQTPIDLRWVEGEVFGAFGGPGAALAAGWFYISVYAIDATHASHAQGVRGPRRADRADHRSVAVRERGGERRARRSKGGGLRAVGRRRGLRRCLRK